MLDPDDSLLVYLPEEGFQAFSFVFKHSFLARLLSRLLHADSSSGFVWLGLSLFFSLSPCMARKDNTPKSAEPCRPMESSGFVEKKSCQSVQPMRNGQPTAHCLIWGPCYMHRWGHIYVQGRPVNEFQST